MIKEGFQPFDKMDIEKNGNGKEIKSHLERLEPTKVTSVIFPRKSFLFIVDHSE